MPTQHTDPVCDMQVEEQNAAGALQISDQRTTSVYILDHRSSTFVRCSQRSRQRSAPPPSCRKQDQCVRLARVFSLNTKIS